MFCSIIMYHLMIYLQKIKYLLLLWTIILDGHLLHFMFAMLFCSATNIMTSWRPVHESSWVNNSLSYLGVKSSTVHLGLLIDCTPGLFCKYTCASFWPEYDHMEHGVLVCYICSLSIISMSLFYRGVWLLRYSVASYQM